MKIVESKNSIKLPKVTTSVERTMNSAFKAMKKQRWRKVIIIGEGPHGAHLSHSKMKYYDILGFIEWNKKTLLDKFANE